MANELETRVQEARDRILDKIAKREFYGLPTDRTKGTLDRTFAFANRDVTDDHTSTKPKDKNKPSRLDDLAKKGNELEKKAKKSGIDFSHSTKEKDDKDKDKEKSKEKEKTTENSKADKNQVLSTIKLPSNARIVEHANKWEIVSEDKNGKEVATDITDVMNKIDSFNRQVNDTNKANSQQSAHIYTPEEKASAVKSQLPNIYHNETENVAEFKIPTNISEKDIPTFKPEDMQALADYAISLSDKDKLFKQVNDRKNDNDRSQDDKNKILAAKLSEERSRA